MSEEKQERVKDVRRTGFFQFVYENFRDESWPYIKCYWTRPIGHHRDSHLKCMNCGHQEYVPPFGGF